MRRVTLFAVLFSVTVSGCGDDEQQVAPSQDALEDSIALPSVDISKRMSIGEVQALPQGAPLIILTTMRGVAPQVLRATYEGWFTQALLDTPYFVVRTDPQDENWPIPGPVHGMSGSPILYKQGDDWRPIGALSLSFGGTPADSDGSGIFGATPVDTVLRVQPGGSDLSGGGSSEGSLITFFGSPEIAELADDMPDLPQMISLAGEVDASAATAYVLTPGAPLTVNLIQGDASLAAGGTVSFIDGDKIWAFGHAFTRAGEVSFPFSGATVFGVNMNPFQGGMKVMMPIGPALGAITADEEPAIAGRIGKVAQTIPFDLTFKSGDIVERRNHFDIAYVPPVASELTPALVCTAAAAAFKGYRGKVMDGSIKTRMEVRFVNSPLVAVRENMTSSGSDLGSSLCSDAYVVIKNFYGSHLDFQVRVASVDMQVEVFPGERKEFRLMSLDIPVTARPGELLNAKVEVHRFGAATTETVLLGLTIPNDCDPGPATLKVGSGPQFASDLYPDQRPAWTLAETVERFNKAFSSDTLGARLLCGPVLCKAEGSCDLCEPGAATPCVACNLTTCPLTPKPASTFSLQSVDAVLTGEALTKTVNVVRP